MTPYLQRMGHSTAARPVTTTYLAAVVVIAFVSQGWVRGDVGVLLLAMVGHLSIVISMRRELRTVHKLVNSQHDGLVDRIDQLVDALNESDTAVPDDPRGKG